MELGWASKTSKKRKRVIRRWHLDRFGDDEVKLSYLKALMAEVHEFSESTVSALIMRRSKNNYFCYATQY